MCGDFELCNGIRDRVSKLISFIAQERTLRRSKEIGEQLMDLKLMSEKLIEKYDEEFGMEPL
jgi:hypothetical protein